MRVDYFYWLVSEAVDSTAFDLTSSADYAMVAGVVGG